MKIEKIKIENWRNYKSLELEFKEITILLGNNTSGKTNILEAISFLTNSKSFRTKEENIIKWGSTYLRVVGNIRKQNRVDDIVVVFENLEGIRKTVKINEQKIPSSKLLKTFNCILFTPEEIELIYNVPEARRRYLNVIISQLDIDYAYNLIYFNRTLKQRNKLLKRISEGLERKEDLDVWDEKFAEYSIKIINWRRKYIENINNKINIYHKMLSENNKLLELNYLPKINAASQKEIIDVLKRVRNIDIAAKITTNGPHRDDFEFLIDKKNITTFASRGEFRTVVLALKLAEVEYFFDHTGETPVLLLDDVFSELDDKRRNLLSQLFINQQTIITTTDIEHISKNIIEKADIIYIERLLEKK